MTGLPEIVKRALVETVINIGQLTQAEVRTLNRAVRKGWLSKGEGGPYPALKTLWARPDFDFATNREYHIEQFRKWHALDVARGVVKR
jgi:hypothetical protein